MTPAEFQQPIRQRYYKTDSQRGPAATFRWLAEEFGELAQAIARRHRGEPFQAGPEEESAALPAVHGVRDAAGLRYAGRYGEWGYLWTDQSFASGERAAARALAG